MMKNRVVRPSWADGRILGSGADDRVATHVFNKDEGVLSFSSRDIRLRQGISTSLATVRTLARPGQAREETWRKALSGVGVKWI